MSGFAGFPKELVAFLRDVSANNNKPWFDDHRSDYEAYWLDPAREFVETMGERLADMVPAIKYEPKVNGSIWRINRDIRFSKDKTPYKDRLDIGFWEGDRKNPASGFWVRITPDTVSDGVGSHMFDKDRLSRFRAAAVDKKKSSSLGQAIAAVEAHGHEMHGEHYKRVPPGYQPANEFQERFVRFASLYTGTDAKHPKQLHSAAFVDWLAERWEPQLPLHRWLVDELG